MRLIHTGGDPVDLIRSTGPSRTYGHQTEQGVSLDPDLKRHSRLWDHLRSIKHIVWTKYAIAPVLNK
jgi:hypothetical protein